MIEYLKVSKTYAGTERPALAPLSLTVKDGTTMALLGSSGSGKTTLLRLTNRMHEPDEGSVVRINGTDVTTLPIRQLRRMCGYVLQRPALLPHLTVEENIVLPLRLDGTDRAARRARAHELLNLVELPPDEYAARHPRQLSGGQQQRVGVARALASDPPVLLMDEPFGALDEVTRQSIQQAFKELRRKIKKTIVLVTHDLFEALELGDRIAVLHEGRLEQVGSPRDLLESPETDYVRDLFARPAATLRAEAVAESSDAKGTA